MTVDRTEGLSVAAGDETIIRTDDVCVRVVGMAPGGAGPWHFHTEVVDNMFCLTGIIAVCLRDPDEEIHLNPGHRLEVLPGRAHRVVNSGAGPATYLLVQGVGKYDFNVVD